jgi:hypothetical protein
MTDALGVALITALASLIATLATVASGRKKADTDTAVAIGKSARDDMTMLVTAYKELSAELRREVDGLREELRACESKHDEALRRIAALEAAA